MRPARTDQRALLASSCAALGLLAPARISARPADQPGAAVEITAARTERAPRIDGAVDDPAWTAAPVFTRFVQSFPRAGAPPGERTELRVLYDDEHIYVAVVCLDSRPSAIHAGMGRRDRPPASDLISVYVDAAHDHRTGLVFTVNAGGVLKDSVITEDAQVNDDWDGLWEGAAARRADGWSAELAIPLGLLRISSADRQVWGLGVRREVARTHELIDTTVIPRSTNAIISRLPHLTGLRGLRHRRSVLLTPYLAYRVISVPLRSDPATPTPKLGYMTADLGLDFQARLASDLRLVGAINPDFGQVEADEIVVNLTTFEPFLPEKRPFFTQDMDLFQPVGSSGGVSPQMLLYSRRIGLDAPILGAAKLTGTLVDGLDVALLDSVVATPANPSAVGGVVDEDDPDLDYRFHPARPLHVGPGVELPARAFAQNYAAAVARTRLGGRATIGAALASATPLGDPCEEEGCPLAGNGATAEWDVGDASRTWVALGQIGASHAVGGPQGGRVLDDGTTIRPGDLGGGGFFRAGKLGGEPIRFQLAAEYSSPRMDFNPTGFQRTQNELAASGKLQLVRSDGFGPLKDVQAALAATLRYTTDGRRLPRGHTLSAGLSALLPGFHALECEGGAEIVRTDVREITGAGVPYDRPAYTFGACAFVTDASRPVSLTLDAYVDRSVREGPLRPRIGGEASIGAVLRPSGRFESEIELGFEAFNDSPNYLSRPAPDRFEFGQATTRFGSLTLRQLVVLGPRLTLQGYAQLFTGWARFGPFYQATSVGGAAIGPADLERVTPTEDPSFQVAALNLNLLARWEYRPGSALFAVLTRAQERLPPRRFEETFAPDDLLDGPAIDVFLVKWSYSWEP